MRMSSPSISGALAHVRIYTAAITPRVCTLVLFILSMFAVVESENLDEERVLIYLWL